MMEKSIETSISIGWNGSKLYPGILRQYIFINFKSPIESYEQLVKWQKRFLFDIDIQENLIKSTCYKLLSLANEFIMTVK